MVLRNGMEDAPPPPTARGASPPPRGGGLLSLIYNTRCPGIAMLCGYIADKHVNQGKSQDPVVIA